MQRVFVSLLLISITKFAVCQKKLPVNLFLHGQANFIVYDIFKKNTGGGFGCGLQVPFKSKHKLKPQIDVTANLFSTNKILYVFANGETTGPKGFFLTVFTGVVYEPVKNFELAVSAGPSFDDDGPDFGIKPYIAYYTGRKKNIKIHTALTHIFSSNKYSTKNTGFISAGLAIKLF